MVSNLVRFKHLEKLVEIRLPEVLSLQLDCAYDQNWQNNIQKRKSLTHGHCIFVSGHDGVIEVVQIAQAIESDGLVASCGLEGRVLST